MATEITVSLFEKNAKLFNKKGLRRRYSSFPDRVSEYARILPLGLTSKFVFEVTIDKDSYQDVADFFVSEGFTVLGSKNTVFLNDIVNDYEKNPALYERFKDGIDALKKDLESLENENTQYEELPENDVKFYVYPYSDNVNTICDFVEQEKDKVLELARKNDITIMIKIIGHTNLINGFFGFNFFDAEKTDEDVIIDYSSTISVATDFKDPGKVLIAAYYLSGIAQDPEDLELLNTHIFADNLKYQAE